MEWSVVWWLLRNAPTAPRRKRWGAALNATLVINLASALVVGVVLPVADRLWDRLPWTLDNPIHAMYAWSKLEPWTGWVLVAVLVIASAAVEGVVLRLGWKTRLSGRRWLGLVLANAVSYALAVAWLVVVHPRLVG